jgi:hypothetical protein
MLHYCFIIGKSLGNIDLKALSLFLQRSQLSIYVFDSCRRAVTALLRAYLNFIATKFSRQNIDLAVLIVERTVEALTHTAVIDRPELLSDGQLEQEIQTFIVLFGRKKPCKTRTGTRKQGGLSATRLDSGC